MAALQLNFSKFYLVNTFISYATVLLCGLNFFQFDGLINSGKLSSPTLLIIIATELLRWLLNKFTFCVGMNAKESTISGLRTSSVTKHTSLLANIKSACKLCGLLLICTIFYALVCVLMGASCQSLYEETLVLSATLTTLTILPIALALGPTKLLQYLFYDSFELSSRTEVSLLELMQYNAFGALIGAWAGSVVAPLDWDRDWQLYPIPNIVGGLIGLTFANTHSLVSNVFGLTKDKKPSEKKTT